MMGLNWEPSACQWELRVGDSLWQEGPWALELRTKRCPSVDVSGKGRACKGDLAGGIGEGGLGSVVSQTPGRRVPREGGREKLCTIRSVPTWQMTWRYLNFMRAVWGSGGGSS